jgi:flavin-dependent dehydrogenase
VYVTPLPEREILVGVLVDGADLDDRPEAFFRKSADAHPYLARLLEGAEQVSALQAISPLEGRARRGYAPGIVLLGDAAGFLDPITGGGMTQALTSAELLACFIAARGCGDEWLEEFEKTRRAILRDCETLTAIVSWMALRPWAARAALGAFPAGFSHLIGVAGGVRRLWPMASNEFCQAARPKLRTVRGHLRHRDESLGSCDPLAAATVAER